MNPDRNRALAAEIRDFALAARPFVLYTAGCLRARSFTKTAEVLARHCAGRLVGVADDLAGERRLRDVPGWGWAADVPVVADPLDLLGTGIDLVVGIALPGSRPLLPEHRACLVSAADAGHRVFNGLHDIIDHPRVVNLRAFDGSERILARNADFQSSRILTVGTGVNVGKMTTAHALCGALVSVGYPADWLPTGQTGMLLRGFGRCIDALPGDFGPGVVEELVMTLESQADTIVIEGQGSIFHPAYSPVTVAISHGSRPQHHVLCHRLDRNERNVIDRLRRAASHYDLLHAALGIRSNLLAVSLDTSRFDTARVDLTKRVGRELGVPCVDVIRDGAEKIADALVALAPPDDQP
jgi:uncharacterized NAD-dependent epimerase/dehydratase family protein